MTLLAKRYATALHLAAKTANAVVQVESDLQSLHAGLQSAIVLALVTSPEIATAERARIVDKLGIGKHPLVQNLLTLMLRRRRLGALKDLYPAFRTICLLERGEMEGVVETPRPLGPDDLARLQELAQKLCGKKCSLSVRVRPDLIGGVRLFVGNMLYDGSVKSTLEQLEQKLLQKSF
ncbi:ATP synthase subunit delta [Planctomycetota bacterium]|jgi:F-type H+-transporting ATPase subunit delta|nr:ATP synthase F1 subunit delta [Planctomycetota bacterium]MSR37306.1 ATP synthase F1 subunit delta [Planctomycetota bacterium]GDY01222.1 ATP synthase subunit delta [Planctomycetota bacterium]